MSEKNPTRRGPTPRPKEDQQVRLHPEQLEAILTAILVSGGDRTDLTVKYARAIAKKIIRGTSND